MKKEDLQPVVAIIVAVSLAALVAVAGSQGGFVFVGVPLFAVCAAAAFLIQWVVFVPSYVGQTEHFFDLTGSITYLSVVTSALVLRGSYDLRSWVIAVLVAVWALRLGTFLFSRVRRAGSDRRFAVLKTRWTPFLMTWTLQGLWVVLTLGAGLAAMTAIEIVPIGLPGLVGLVLWAGGFAIEVAADRQKSSFRADPANRDRFIRHGLWAWSRHPNYFGEIVLWLGIALIALPALSGWQYATLVSPLFVCVLLSRISGVPLLEARAMKKWSGNPEYDLYRRSTPTLLLRRPRLRSGSRSPGA